MEKEIRKMLPGILIDNTPFIIDLDAKAFRRYSDNTIVIRFDELNHQDGYCSCFISRELIGIGKVPIANGAISNDAFHLVIPEDVLVNNEISPNKLADYNLASTEHNWGFYLADELLVRRLVGELPHIEIEGSDFTIDWRLKELRETEAPFNCLRFSNMELSENGEQYLFLSHRQAHNICRPQPDINHIPGELVLTSIPNELKLDPVGVARQYGLKDFELLREFPIQTKLKAERIPFTLDRDRMTAQQNNKSQTVQKKKRSGKHL
ncbi:MAG: hypothetical protein ACTHJ0_01120 [Flavipsychrobacter sp.]